MVSHPLFTLENIYRAFMQCRKRKRRTINALIFEENLEENLVALHHELNNGSYHPGAYQAFLVEKPKRREIFAADFRDRVVHHILVHHLEKKWEPIFIYDSYACRQEKGTHKAVYRLRSFTLQATCNQTLILHLLNKLNLVSQFPAFNKRTHTGQYPRQGHLAQIAARPIQ